MNKTLNILCVAVASLALLPALAAQQPAAPPPPPNAAPPDPNQPKSTPAPPAVEVTPKKPVDMMPAKLALSQEETALTKSKLLNTQAAAEVTRQTAPLEAQYNQAEKDLTAWLETVRKENGWGTDVILDRNTLKFMRNPPPPTPPAAPATPPAK